MKTPGTSLHRYDMFSLSLIILLNLKIISATADHPRSKHFDFIFFFTQTLDLAELGPMAQWPMVYDL